MALNLLRSPGIQITERDLSQYTDAPNGTAVLVVGFASKGRDYEPMYLTSRSAWLTQYGEPTNEAERYFFNASMEVINQGGMLYCCKLPYKNDALDKMTAKTYKFTGEPIELMTVADYIKNTNYLENVLAGNYIDFGIPSPGEPNALRDAFLALDKTAEDFYALKKLYLSVTEEIPYFYMRDEWLGSFDPEAETDGAWTFTPLYFIYDFLSALFDPDSDFRQNLKAFLSTDPYLSTDALNFEPLKGAYDGRECETVQDLISAYAIACERAFDGAKLSSSLFRYITRPDNGLTEQRVIESYPNFDGSILQRFYKANEKIFDFIGKNASPAVNNELFNGQCPYFYCDDSKFNLATYYVAIAKMGGIIDAREKIANTNIADSYNSIIDSAIYADNIAGTGNFVETELLKGIEAVGVPPSAYALCDDVDGLDRFKWENYKEAADALTDKLIELPTTNILKVVDSLNAVLKSDEYQQLINGALNGVFYASPLIKQAVDFYLDRTIVEDDDKLILKQANSFNAFYNATGDKTFFEKYNGEDSSAPELSSVSALVEALIATLTKDEFLKIVEKLNALEDFSKIKI